MITFEFHSGSEVRTINYTDKGGKPATMFKQEGYVQLLDKNGSKKPYPEKTTVNLTTDNKGQPQPYAPGLYILHPSSFYLDRFGNVTVAPRLVPAKSS
jgi:hypothetical protein